MELTKKSELLIAPEYLKALEQVGVANPHLYCILTYAMRNMNADNVCKTTVGLLADELSFSTKRINIELSNAKKSPHLCKLSLPVQKDDDAFVVFRFSRKNCRLIYDSERERAGDTANGSTKD